MEREMVESDRVATGTEQCRVWLSQLHHPVPSPPERGVAQSTYSAVPHHPPPDPDQRMKNSGLR